jgi:hypothetical protein
MDDQRLANFIIGGTEKAGTTSVFMYLSQHPEVCAASRKETDFFRDHYSGDADQDRATYATYFQRCSSRVPVVMEASPGYLGEADTVVERMRTMLPELKLLFILRDPRARLYSSYNFHKSKLNIPEDLSFSDFVAMCRAYDQGKADASDGSLDDWQLKTLRFGCYADSLEKYYAAFPKEQIKVMFFESLNAEPREFMRELGSFLNIDDDFWNSFEFSKTNVTFSGRIKFLHRIAMALNTYSEPFLRRHPQLKASLVDFYKRINQAREGYDPMPPDVIAQLDEYYSPSNASLSRMLNRPLPEAWGGSLQ